MLHAEVRLYRRRWNWIDRHRSLQQQFEQQAGGAALAPGPSSLNPGCRAARFPRRPKPSGGFQQPGGRRSWRPPAMLASRIASCSIPRGVHRGPPATRFVWFLPSLLQRGQRACSGPLPGNPAAWPCLLGALGIGQPAPVACAELDGSLSAKPCRRLGRNGVVVRPSPGINEDDSNRRLLGGKDRWGLRDTTVLHDHAATNSSGSGNHNDARGYLERERVHLALGDDSRRPWVLHKRACSLCLQRGFYVL